MVLLLSIYKVRTGNIEHVDERSTKTIRMSFFNSHIEYSDTSHIIFTCLSSHHYIKFTLIKESYLARHLAYLVTT